jgi:CRISPR-associated endonuclease Csy4
MVAFYQDLTLLPDAEVPVNFLLSKVYMQIHIALGSWKNHYQNQPFGISFPEYGDKGLGSKVRIFSENREQLEELNLPDKLTRYRDYVHLTTARKVPAARVKGYASYSRYQPDGTPEQKARRYVSRHPETNYEAALVLMKQRKEDYKNPYIQLKSLSNGNKFNLFVIKEEKPEAREGTFSTYGLSSEASVPEF